MMSAARAIADRKTFGHSGESRSDIVLAKVYWSITAERQWINCCVRMRYVTVKSKPNRQANCIGTWVVRQARRIVAEPTVQQPCLAILPLRLDSYWTIQRVGLTRQREIFSTIPPKICRIVRSFSRSLSSLSTQITSVEILFPNKILTSLGVCQFSYQSSP